MTPQQTSLGTSINIRPGVSILAVLRHLNYRPWYALAEFVDNAIQSFLSHREEITHTDGSNIFSVDITIDIADGGLITVRDNAAGIYEHEYDRAFRPAEVPPDRNGLCEFGMGMKNAACWFANRWTVRTSALGESVERTIDFDISRIVNDRIEELAISSRQVPNNYHYTEVKLLGLHHLPQGRTVNKIKDHLAGIYRVFFREGILHLTLNGEPLRYEEPQVLNAAHYRNPTDEPVVWRKDIEFDFGMGQRASGFAALRARASTSTAGFALFRRKRLIQGSGDETYRPKVIFGHPNSYRYQRLFGELHLEGFEISHTKDGFRWDDNEDVFLDLLKDYLTREPLDLLDQAEGFRVRPPRQELVEIAEIATENTAKVIEQEVPPILAREIIEGPDPNPPPPELPTTLARASQRVIDIELEGQPWQVVLETTVDPSIGEWISISDKSYIEDQQTRQQIRRVAVRMSLAHPFMDRFGGTDANTIETLLRLAAAIGLAYTAARDAGATLISTILRNINDMLRNALSKP